MLVALLAIIMRKEICSKILLINISMIMPIITLLPIVMNRKASLKIVKPILWALENNKAEAF